MEEMDYSPYVPNVHFELIPIRNLVSNQTYQRELSRSHIERTIRAFDKNQLNPVKVSRRDGVNYVMDGQHTVEIVNGVSGSQDTPVWCMVYDDLEYKVEAGLFAEQQKYTRRLTPYQIYVAHIEAGNDEQLIIQGLVESYGLSIAKTRGPCILGCISALEWIYENFSYHTLDRALRLCVAAWEGDVNSMSGLLLKAIAIMIMVYKDDMRDDLFKEKVGAITPKDVARLARERGGGTLAVVEVLLTEYNKRMKGNTLPWRRLNTLRDAGLNDSQSADNEDELEQTESIEEQSGFV